MAEQESKALLDDECEADYIDFSNGKVVEKELRKAFAEYAWPRAPKDKYWTRGLGKEKLRPKKQIYERRGFKFCIPRLLKILALNARNFPVHETAIVCGITDRLLFRWIKRGIDEGSGPYWVFARAFTQMRASYKANLLGIVHRFIFKPGHVPTESEAKMALATLAQQFPQQFGNKLDVTSGGRALAGGAKVREVRVRFMAPGPDGTPVVVEPPKTTEKHVLEGD